MAGFATLRRLAGEAQEALPLIERACAINPKHDWNRLEFGYVLRDVGRVEEAAAKFETIGNDSPVLVLALMALGEMARTQGNHRSAGNFFEQAAGRAENPTDALRNLAAVRRATSDFGLRRKRSRGSWCTIPHPMSDLWKLASKRAMNDRPGAREAFLRAAEIAPANPQPHVEIATVDLECANVKGAAAAVETALRIDPGHHDALLKRGHCLQGKVRTRTRSQSTGYCRWTRPDAASSYLAAVELMATMGETDAALSMLATARERCRPNSQIDFKEAQHPSPIRMSR